MQKYQIVEYIGQGSFGKVYKATNLYNNEIVAFKVISKVKHIFLLKVLRLFWSNIRLSHGNSFTPLNLPYLIFCIICETRSSKSPQNGISHVSTCALSSDLFSFSASSTIFYNSIHLLNLHLLLHDISNASSILPSTSPIIINI